jgi:glycosyltransferase involved in cell wall biosynthesis
VERHASPTVLFVGRLAEEKHVDVLIDAVSKTPADLDIHLEIVGGGEVRPALEAQVARLGLQDRITFLGLASDAELRKAYLAADLFCMPGTAELQSLVTLEAMSASTPVLLADAMALPHLVRDGENGYLFTPNDSDDLAAKMVRVLTLPAGELAAMGKGSRGIVESHSLERTLKTFEDIYRGASYDDLVV